MSANLRHLRAPALANWIAEALSESGEQQSGVNLIARERRQDGSEALVAPLRLVRRDARALELRELSVELEGHEPGEPWSFFG